MAAAACVVGLAAASGPVNAAPLARATPLYLDAGAPVAARVDDLLRRMTLAEKVGQMDQIVVGRLRDTTNPANGDCTNAGGNTDPLQPNCLDKVLIKNFTGSILAGGTDNPADNTGKGWADWANTIQHYAIEHSRLHIPVILGVDAVHGFGHPFQAPLFPHSIGIGATWDPAQAEAGGAVTGERGPRRRLELGLRPGPGHLPRPAVGPRLRDLGRAAGAELGAGRRVRPRPAGPAATGG